MERLFTSITNAGATATQNKILCRPVIMPEKERIL